jgi:hypothetical protein
MDWQPCCRVTNPAVRNNWFRKHFLNHDHETWAFPDSGSGPVIICLRVDHEKQDNFGNGLHRALLCTVASDSHEWVPFPLGTKLKRGSGGAKQLYKALQDKFHHLGNDGRWITRNPVVAKELDLYSESHVVKGYKFGMLYCSGSQTTEEEMFSNKAGSPGRHIN